MTKISTNLLTAFFTDKSTGILLKRFDYPAKGVPGKFYWEKIKAEELNKLTKSRDIDPNTVKVTDHSSYY